MHGKPWRWEGKGLWTSSSNFILKLKYNNKNNKNCGENGQRPSQKLSYAATIQLAFCIYLYITLTLTLCSWSKDILKSNKELEIIKVHMGPVCRVWQNWMRSCACNVILACRIVLPPAILCWLHEAVQISITYASTSGEGMLIHCSYRLTLKERKDKEKAPESTDSSVF